MTSIVIVGLGAVVILIVVVVLAAMHYLRAEAADDFDDLPDERVTGAVGRDRHSGLRRPGRDVHRPARAGAEERRRPGRDEGPRDDGARRRGPERGYRDRPDQRDYPGDRDYDGRRSARQPAAGYDDRRAAAGQARHPDGPQRRQDSLPAVRPRAARGSKKADDADWPSTEWDELSDVDYWAEVASDKPLTTTAQLASGDRSGRSERGGKAGARPAEASPGPAGQQSGQPGPAPSRSPQHGSARGSRPDQAPKQEAAPRLPVRRQHAAAAARAPEVAVPLAAPHQAQPEAGHWRPAARTDAPPAGPARGALPSEPSLAMLASLGGQRGPVPYADDDPLTSPSFPAIQDDSRSYRNGRGRGASAPHRSPVSPAAPTQQMAAYPQAPGQFDGYGPGAPGNAAEPAGYRQPAPAAEPASPQPYQAAAAAPPAAAGYQGNDGQAYGNPYGSYVGSPAGPGPEAGSVPARYDGYPAGPGAGLPQVSYQQLPAGSQVPAPAAGPGGWYPADGYPALPGGHEAGYRNGNGVAGQAGYPDGQGGYLPAGYAAPQDRGHAGVDPYNQDPYGGYPGYGTGR